MFCCTLQLLYSGGHAENYQNVAHESFINAVPIDTSNGSRIEVRCSHETTRCPIQFATNVRYVRSAIVNSIDLWSSSWHFNSTGMKIIPADSTESKSDNIHVHSTGSF